MNDRALQEKVERLELLHKVGIALSAEQNKDRLVEMILMEAKNLCNADGGTLYLRTEDDHLRWAIVRNRSLNFKLGGIDGRDITFKPIHLYHEDGKQNEHNVASYCAHAKRSINIADAYEVEGFDFSGTKAFDAANNYRSKSFLTLPLVNYEGHVIGVLQLINAKDPQTGETIPFSPGLQEVVEALASQAAISLDNQLLLESQRTLWDSFIKMLASAIDAKSHHTGAHCERVPILMEMITRAVCEWEEGPFADFHMSEKDWYELRIAAWMHDCGKVTTPVHVMEKATKLETIFDRIQMVRERFEILRRDAEIDYLRAVADGADADTQKKQFEDTCAELEESFSFLEKANYGGEFLEPKVQQRIRDIGKRQYIKGGQAHPLLTDDEIKNLIVNKGTLTDEERLIINGHMVQTVKMLEALPFPRNLKNVPEYACGHHEKMDGTGYPRGIYAGDMSVPARIMAIADVFEALTAQDRPYKKGKTLSETVYILSKMKEFNHLDPDLLDVFIKSGIYKEYGRRFLPPELVDEVDENILLGVAPKPFDLPPEEERRKRLHGFLPQYKFLEDNVLGES